MPAELTVEQEGLQSLGRALKEEADGKALRRDLMKGMRTALDKTKEDARSNLMGIASAGLSAGESLRTAVATQMKAETRLSGRSTGARLRVRRRGMPRGFNNAPKALNNPRGWRHRVYGRDVWVGQIEHPTEWFDRAAREGAGRDRDAVLAAMEAMAQRIANNTRKG